MIELSTTGYGVGMTLAVFLLLLAALICFALAALNVTSRIALGWLGLAFWVTIPFIHAAQNLAG